MVMVSFWSESWVWLVLALACSRSWFVRGSGLLRSPGSGSGFGSGPGWYWPLWPGPGRDLVLVLAALALVLVVTWFG